MALWSSDRGPPTSPGVVKPKGTHPRSGSAGIASNENAPAAARVSAVALLFERGWGRPPQAHTGEDGDGPIVVEIVYRNQGENAKVIEHQAPDQGTSK
jgi:hypothetical protein